MASNGFRQSDRPFMTALADANRVFHGIDFSDGKVDLAEAAFTIARAALPHALHMDTVGDAALAYVWIAACNQAGILAPAAQVEKLMELATVAPGAQLDFLRQNASLAKMLGSHPAFSQPVMSAAA